MVDSPDLKPTSEAETATRRELTIRHRKILSSEWTSPQIQSKLPILWTAITFLASLRMNYVEDEKKKSCPIFLITLYGIAYTRPAYLRVRENPNWGRTLLARRKHAIEMNIVRGKKGQQLTPLEIELFEIMDAAKQFVPFDMILKLDSIMRAAEGVPAPAKSSEVPDSLRGDLRAYQTVSEEEEKQLRVDPEEEERLRKRSEKERDEKKRDLRSKIVHYKEVAKNCMNHLADGDSVEAYERNLADTRLKLAKHRSDLKELMAQDGEKIHENDPTFKDDDPYQENILSAQEAVQNATKSEEIFNHIVEIQQRLNGNREAILNPAQRKILEAEFRAQVANFQKLGGDVKRLDKI